MQLLLFYVFGALAVGAGLMVVFAKNAMRAVLSLVLTFVSMACIWLLLSAEFLSIALVVVYVGAVMVLFLFVVMMIDLDPTGDKTVATATGDIKKHYFVKYLPLGLLVAASFVVFLTLLFKKPDFGLEAFPLPIAKAADYSHVKALGEILYTDYLLAFELAGVILLVSMIAAIGITFRGPRVTKTQKPSAQIQVQKADRLTMLSLKAETVAQGAGQDTSGERA